MKIKVKKEMLLDEFIKCVNPELSQGKIFFSTGFSDGFVVFIQIQISVRRQVLFQLISPS